VTRQTDGEMVWEGQPVTPENPAHARSLGAVWFATHAQVVQWAKAHAN